MAGTLDLFRGAAHPSAAPFLVALSQTLLVQARVAEALTAATDAAAWGVATG